MKYISDEENLYNFFVNNGMKVTKNKGNIDLSAISTAGTIINWYKKTGTILIQGSGIDRQNLEEQLNIFLNSKFENKTTGKIKQKVYIVHGHDLASKEQLENLLYSWNLKPLVTQDRAPGGRTIIEALERDLSECDYCIVLLTPDDIGFSKESSEKAQRPRARQNVILELGIAIGKLGRDKILVLRKSEIEEPSDILGMIYESFNDHVSEIKDKIRKSLVKADIKIQENNN